MRYSYENWDAGPAFEIPDWLREKMAPTLACGGEIEHPEPEELEELLDVATDSPGPLAEWYRGVLIEKLRSVRREPVPSWPIALREIVRTRYRPFLSRPMGGQASP